MFSPDLVLLNKFEDAEERFTSFETAFGKQLAKRNLRINYLAYFEDVLGIPLKEIEGDKR